MPQTQSNLSNANLPLFTCRAALLAAALAWFLGGCAAEVTGPTPSISGTPGAEDPEQAPTTPGFACNEQLTTWIELRGADFSPLVVDAIDADKEARAVLPTVTLTRSGDVEGTDDGQDFVVVLQATEDEETPVRWLDGGLMSFRVDPALGLTPGIYDVKVSNANGRSVSLAGAFGVAPRPVAAAIVDDLICVAQGDRQVTISGEHLLVRGQERPTVSLGDQRYEVEAAEGCRELAPVFGAWTSCASVTLTIGQGDLSPGRIAVGVTNPAPAACANDPGIDGVELIVVPPPTVADIQPEPVCSEQLDYDAMTVTGTGFLAVTVEGSPEALPTIRVGERTYPATSVEGCEDVPGPVHEAARACTTVRFAMAAGDQPPGNQPVSVENPAPAGCASVEAVELTVAPPPSLSGVAPQPICTAQGDNPITLIGEGFLTIDGQGPTVTIGESTYESAASDCEPVVGPAADVQTCLTLEVTVPAGDLPESGVYEVSVTNPDPAGCTTVEAITLTVVPPPTVAGVEPDFLCAETREARVTIRGEGFLDLSGALPAVRIGDQEATVEGVDGCQEVAGVQGARTCATLTATIAAGLQAGSYEVTVINPAPAGCASEQAVSLLALEAPSVASMEPALFCTSLGDTSVTVSGAGLFVVDGALPEVLLGDQAFPGEAVGGCEAVEGPSAVVQRCTSVTATIPEGALPVDVYAVGLRNPAPVGCQSQDEPAVQAIVAGGPRVLDQRPPALCRGQFDGALTLEGVGFFQIDGALPSVVLNGLEDATVTAIDGCETVSGFDGVEICTSLSVEVPLALRDQDLTVAVTNPAPVDCETSTLELRIEEPPVIDDAQPRKICDTGGSLTLTGRHFVDGMSVELDGVAAETVEVISDTEAVATWTAALEPGLRELVATTPNGCFGVFPTLIRVTSGPVVFFVDPPVLFNGLSVQVTIYLGNLFGGSVERVFLTDSQAQDFELDFVFDPQTPNRLQAVVPSGLAAGLYDVTLIDEVGCDGTTEDLVRITDTVRISMDSVTPPFGWTEANTSIRVKTADPIPNGEVGFLPTPRVYINPSNPVPGDVATELRATILVNTTELSGVVRAGLPPGTYDAIAVNPDGTVGVLQGAFTVTAEPPPVVLTVTPGSWETNNTALAVTVIGESFRDADVTALCKDSGGAILPSPPIQTTTLDPQTLRLSVNTGTLSHLSVCILRVTNDDGTFEEFSPVTVTNPAGNFVAFRAGPALGTPRRSPATFSGTPSRLTRLLYAVGGDSGALAGALNTGEYAQLDGFGEPGPWTPLPDSRPAPRPRAHAARIDDFVYLAGGHDGTQAVNSVLRAQILDPLAVPVINDLDFEFLDEGQGLETGVYIYRVSAILSGDADANPDGETLPSEPQPVFVPALAQGVSAIIEWTEIPDAVAYRVYRSPLPDLAFGAETLLAELPADTTAFIDDGTDVPGVDTPLPIGALGRWHTVATLTTARFDHGVAVSPDPADPSLQHIILAGGDTGQGLTASIEIVSVRVHGPADQRVVNAQSLPNGLAQSRTGLEIVVASSSNASLLGPGVVKLYVLSGAGAGNATLTDVTVASILPGGLPGPFTSTEALRPFRRGYAAAAANNALVAVGGQGGDPSSTGASTDLLSNGQLDNWNSLGNTNLTARVNMGRAVFVGFFYLIGGRTELNAASNTMDFSVLGGVP